MENVSNIIEWLEKHPVTSPILLSIMASIYIIYKFFSNGESAEMKPVFWTFRKKYKIKTVRELKLSDSTSSGYENIKDSSRKDQWEKLITIKSSIFWMKYTIIPLNPDAILIVVISRNGTEKWKNISFNMPSA